MTLKRVFGLLLLSAVAVGFAAAADKKVPLDLMLYGDNSSAESELIQATVDAFKAANPNIDVTYSITYDNAYHEKARARIAGKNAPDVMYQWAGARTDYIVRAGVAIDQSKFIDKSKFIPAALAPQGPKGEIWEVPMGVTVSSVLYTNTALLKQLGLQQPKTYADLVAMVKPLKAKGIDVIAFAGNGGWVYNSCLVSTLVGRYAGATWVRDAIAGKNKFTDKVFVDALAFMKKMFDDGVINPASVSNDYGAPLAQFLKGKAVFLLDGAWRGGGMAEGGFENNVTYGILPALPGEKFPGITSVEVSTGYGITAAATRDPAVLDAAKKFLDFFNAEAQALPRLQKGVATASLVSITKNPPADLPVLSRARLVQTTDNLKGCDILDGFIPSTSMAVLNTGMDNLVLGKTTPEKAAADLEKSVREVLAAAK